MLTVFIALTVLAYMAASDFEKFAKEFETAFDSDATPARTIQRAAGTADTTGAVEAPRIVYGVSERSDAEPAPLSPSVARPSAPAMAQETLCRAFFGGFASRYGDCLAQELPEPTVTCLNRQMTANSPKQAAMICLNAIERTALLSF